MDNKSETGINKAWAQGELTKRKKELIDLHKIPEDATIPQIDEEPTINFSPHGDGSIMMELPVDAKNTAKLFWDGKHVGTISIKDGKTFHFEGNMDDSAASFLIVLKQFIDNWLQMKEK